MQTTSLKFFAARDELSFLWPQNALVRSKNKLSLEKITSHFWIIPAFIIISLMVLLYSIKGLRIYSENPFIMELTFIRADTEAVRLVLSSIATSIMTVIGVVFSVIVVVIAQMSSQFTPRVVANFTRSVTAQVVLGFFVGTFCYCLILLMNIGENGQDRSQIPNLAVSVAAVLSLVCLVLLIFYIHKVTNSIQSTEVIKNIAAEAIEALKNIVSDREDKNIKSGTTEFGFMQSYKFLSHKFGYIDFIDWNKFPTILTTKRWEIDFHVSPGDFVQKEFELVTIWTDQKLDGKELQKIESIFQISPDRTYSQDPGYGIQKLSDIALKALSPGINDPSTAVEAIHSMTSILLEYVKYFPLPESICLGPGKIINFVPLDMKKILTERFDHISQFAKNHKNVMDALQSSLTTISDRIENPELKIFLEMKMETIEQSQLLS